MLDALKPLKPESLKTGCVEQIEALILSGTIKAKEKLPPEREIARQLGVSRPVVHDALVDLAAKGLVSQIPRVGTVVNDFRKHGSLALLESILNYRGGAISPELLDSLLAMRLLIETEMARLSALNRKSGHLSVLKEIHTAMHQADPMDEVRLTSLDFDFHHQIAMASGNVTYPMFLNSFKAVYTHLSGMFFRNHTVVPEILSFHKDLLQAIYERNETLSMEIMKNMLCHGERHLKTALNEKETRHDH